MRLQKLKLILERLLFSAHIFVMVILVAENILVIPPWLFVLGRLHPLLLHFPIVLLLLGIMIIFFPRVLKNPQEQYYYGSALLLLGSLSSAVTVIAGFFLYLEGGESSAVLQYHKWTGLAVFWTSSLLYASFENLGKFSGARQFLASLAGISIIATGHFGASITHGQDFITAPLFGPTMEEVSLEEALVFDHVIQPILENKCVGCHKASKHKGELRLDKVEHILKGGETGPALVPGDADNSLIARRILLPEEEEHHMPPEGKPQLTPEEKDLITAWISSGASFDQKLLNYDPQAPLFQLASQIFQDRSSSYSFDAVDPETIKSLNHVYRQVSPLAAGSPALSVSYFGRHNFEVSTLEELLEVRENVVEFNLNNMTLEDRDLETLSGFANLEKLLINFNNTKGEGLTHLSSLKALSTLSLAGNSLDEKAVSALSSLRGLRKLYLWETGLTEDQISRLREKLPHTAIETGYVDDGTVYQLNPPVIKHDGAFFQGTASIQMKHSILNVSIHYTLDGSYPDSINFLLYREPVPIDSNTVVRARAFAEGWHGSEESAAEFIKADIRPATFFLKFPPEDRYRGDLVHSLFDREKGVMDSWSQSWLGFMNFPLEVEMGFSAPEDINSLAMSVWNNEGMRFFPPAEVEIWITIEDGSWIRAHQSRPPQPKKGDPAGLKLIPIPFKAEAVEKMRLIAKPLSALPGWHGAKGEKAWILVDELVIN